MKLMERIKLTLATQTVLDSGTAGRMAQVIVDAMPDTFQKRVLPWMLECFGVAISKDWVERNHRFIEEALELVQACGMGKADALTLVDYVYDRPIGEVKQEVGGVMVTLAALCLANNVDMHECGEEELLRIWTKVESIREKQKTKPKGSALPQYVETRKDFDYKKMLKAYIEHVGECEGIDFLYNARVEAFTIPTTQAELDEMRRISDNPLDAQPQRVALPHPPEALSRWKHKKSGKFYIVNMVSNLNCTKPGWVPMVTYMNMHEGEIYSRPLAEWTPERYERAPL